MKTENTEQQINHPVTKQEWARPDVTLISVNDETLGVSHAGSDMYASHS